MRKNMFFVLVVLTMVISCSVVLGATSNPAVLSISLVNQDPDPGVAGEVVEVRIGFLNVGGDVAKNLIAELSPEYPFELVSGETSTRDVGTLGAYQEEENMKIIKYKIRIDEDAKAGTYDLDLKYYESGTAAIKTKTLSIDVKNKETSNVIYVDKTSLIPGEQTDLSFSVHNVGNAPLRDVTFSWESEDQLILPVGSDNTRYIDSVAIGQKAELDYTVIADSEAEPGLYQLDLYLSYKDPLSGVTQQAHTVAGMFIGGQADFEITYSETLEGESLISIVNSGSNPASSVSMTVPAQDSWDIIGSGTYIIGNLDKGESSDVSLTVKPKGEGNEPLQVKIAYTDTFGSRRTIIEELYLNPERLTFGETDFDVVFSESSNGETSFSIANIGRNPAYSVSVIVPSQMGWAVSGSNSVIIGNLNNGDYTIASFSITANGGSMGGWSNASARSSADVQDRMRQRGLMEGNNTLSGARQNMNLSMTGFNANEIQINIAYTDTVGQRNVVEKRVPLQLMGGGGNATSMAAFGAGRTRTTTAQQPGFLSKYKYYLIGLIILVAAMVGYGKYRRRKMHDPGFGLLGKKRR